MTQSQPPPDSPNPYQNPVDPIKPQLEQPYFNAGFVGLFYLLQVIVIFCLLSTQNLIFYWQIGPFDARNFFGIKMFLYFTCWAGAWIWLGTGRSKLETIGLGIMPLFLFTSGAWFWQLSDPNDISGVSACVVVSMTLALVFGFTLQTPFGLYCQNHKRELGIPLLRQQIVEFPRVQFGIRHILVLTTLIAAFLALTRLELYAVRILHYGCGIVEYLVILPQTIIVVLAGKKFPWGQFGILLAEMVTWLCLLGLLISAEPEVDAQGRQQYLLYCMPFLMWNTLSILILRWSGLRLLTIVPRPAKKQFKLSLAAFEAYQDLPQVLLADQISEKSPEDHSSPISPVIEVTDSDQDEAK